jgi:hypothetical protein
LHHRVRTILVSDSHLSTASDQGTQGLATPVAGSNKGWSHARLVTDINVLLPVQQPSNYRRMATHGGIVQGSTAVVTAVLKTHTLQRDKEDELQLQVMQALLTCALR